MSGHTARGRRVLREWPLAIALGAIGFALYPLVHAELAMIDDWGIVDILGRGATFGNLLWMIGQNAIEDNGRFRPGCMALWDLEIVAAGADAGRWHANRLLMAGISASALYVAARVFLSPVAAALVALMFFSGPQNESWTRLGACESHGDVMLLVGLAVIAVQLSRGVWRPARLALGLVLVLFAGFVKESYIPFLPATLVFVYGVLPWTVPKVFADRGRPSPMDVAVVLLLVAGVVTQVGMTVRALQTYGHFNSADTTVMSFVSAMWWMLRSYARNTLWFVPVAAGLAALTADSLRDRHAPDRVRDLFRALVLLTAGGFLILVPQAVVYAGSYQGGRYLTPGNIFVPFASMWALYFLSRGPVTHMRAELRGGVLGMVAVASVAGIVVTHREAVAEAASTRRFQGRVTEIVELKQQHSELPLLFHSADPSDREALVSVATYVRARLPNREKPFLRTFDWQSDADSLMKKRLAEIILDQSVNGDDYFAPIAGFPGTDGRCIAVIFSGFEEGHQCAHGIHARDR